ncbi:MAG: class I SAM-dependent methyltransferase [Bryobacterales bacterium]|nr:class I SAM-dependent methyltransferase [Bryobacterales bacterium]
MTQPTATANTLMQLETVLSKVNGVRPAVQAVLACPHCRGGARLADLACAACGYRLEHSHGVLQPGTAESRNRFGNYSNDTGLPQYVGLDLSENEYYMRFLTDAQGLVVDCGGGAAHASARWARLHPEHDLLVVDMDEHGLRKAAQRGLANLTPLVAPIQTLPLADNSADMVFTTFVVEHLYDWELSDFYLEAHRVLRPGGRLVVQSDAAFFDKYIHPFLRLLKGEGWRTSEFLQRWDTSIHAVHHHNLKTAREQRAIVERHGFFIQGMEAPLLFSNRLPFAAAYEVAAGVLPLAWIERFFATSYTIVASKLR